MSLTFRNMTLDVSVFFLFRQPDLNEEDCNDVSEANLIDTLVQDVVKLPFDTNSLEACIPTTAQNDALAKGYFADICHVDIGVPGNTTYFEYGIELKK